jgi:hypothetical protein
VEFRDLVRPTIPLLIEPLKYGISDVQSVITALASLAEHGALYLEIVAVKLMQM